MNAIKMIIATDAAIPLIAAFPFAFATRDAEAEPEISYNPATQLATFRSGRNGSTCRVEGSVFKYFRPSIADTQKDD